MSSYDFNPISQEQQQAAIHELQATLVYWSPHGHVYHTSIAGQAITNSEELTEGTAEQAIAAGREKLCKFCAKRDDINTEGMLLDGDPDDVVIDTQEEAGADDALDTVDEAIDDALELEEDETEAETK
ncbi:MAG: hypothetical protein IJT91_08150 [Clostridia bacterium]|nr:hypothetical protein [Clostridia bacterium]